MGGRVGRRQEKSSGRAEFAIQAGEEGAAAAAPRPPPASAAPQVQARRSSFATPGCSSTDAPPALRGGDRGGPPGRLSVRSGPGCRVPGGGKAEKGTPSAAAGRPLKASGGPRSASWSRENREEGRAGARREGAPRGRKPGPETSQEPAERGCLPPPADWTPDGRADRSTWKAAAWRPKRRAAAPANPTGREGRAGQGKASGAGVLLSSPPRLRKLGRNP